MTSIIARLFQFVIVFVSYQVAIKLFEPADYGKLTLFFVVASFFILLTISPFGSFLLANCQKWHRQRSLINRLSAVILIAIIFTIAITVLFLIGMLYFDALDNYFLLIGLYLFGSAVTQTMIPLIAVIFSIRVSILAANLNALGCLLASYFLVYIFGLEIINWILGQIIFQCLFAVGLYFKFFYTSSLSLSFEDCKNFLKTSYKFASITSLISVLTWALYQMPKVLYSNIFDETTFGLLMAGFVLSGYIFAGFEALVNMYAQTFFYRDFDPESPEYSGAWVLYLFRVTFCFSAIFMILLPILDQASIHLFVGDYSDSRNYLLIGIICEYFRVIGGCFVISGQYIQRPEVNIKPLAVSVLFAIALVANNEYILNLPPLYIASLLPLCFFIYICLAVIWTRQFETLSFGSYTRRLTILVISVPLYLLLFILTSNLISTPEFRLAWNVTLFLVALVFWLFLFSRHILGGQGLINSLKSGVD